MTNAAGVAGVLVGAAVLAMGERRRIARNRVVRLSMGEASAPSPRRPALRLASASTVLVLTLPILVWFVGTGPVFAALVPLLVLGTRRRLIERSAARERQRQVAIAVPRFADLVAACLEAGATPADALDVVCRHLPGPLADRLTPVVGALRSGVDPRTVCADHGRDDPARVLVTSVSRAIESGAPLADTVSAVADEQRRRRRWAAEAAARRAGVHAVGPLVVCFLPAFVLLGVVPVVLGIAAEVLGDLS